MYVLEVGVSPNVLEGAIGCFWWEVVRIIFNKPEIFWGRTATWTPLSLRLPPAARGQKVIVEFVLLTAGAENGFAGWYIDDVTID